jgi:hypothetical protein
MWVAVRGWSLGGGWLLGGGQWVVDACQVGWWLVRSHQGFVAGWWMAARGWSVDGKTLMFQQMLLKEICAKSLESRLCLREASVQLAHSQRHRDGSFLSLPMPCEAGFMTRNERLFSFSGSSPGIGSAVCIQTPVLCWTSAHSALNQASGASKFAAMCTCNCSPFSQLPGGGLVAKGCHLRMRSANLGRWWWNCIQEVSLEAVN